MQFVHFIQMRLCCCCLLLLLTVLGTIYQLSPDLAGTGKLSFLNGNALEQSLQGR